jgi:hypothetical protein
MNADRWLEDVRPSDTEPCFVFLEAHPVIEVWSGARRIARLTNEIADGAEATTDGQAKRLALDTPTRC